MKHKLISLSVLLLLSVFYFAQHKRIHNGAIIYLIDGSKLVGELVENNKSDLKLKLISGDVVTLLPKHRRKTYLPQEIVLFNGSKFHYQKGFVFEMSYGTNWRGNALDFSTNWKFKDVELGLGTGIHNNSIPITIQDIDLIIEPNTRPHYLQAKYNLTDSYMRFYLKGVVGLILTNPFSNQSSTSSSSITTSNNNTTVVNNNSLNDFGTRVNSGVLLEGAIGVTFASKKKVKHYLELSQYSQRISGTHTDAFNSNFSELDFNIWINRIQLTYGITIGR